MGNCTIDTHDTRIYYPSEWLIEGGPPFDDCPEAEVDKHSMTDPLSIVYIDSDCRQKPWKVVMGDWIVMESADPKDAAKYMEDYMHELQAWIARQR